MLSFEEALDRSAEIDHKRHVLLGNGFSIACRPDCFSYEKLFDEADLSSLSVAGEALFANEQTTDFEQVIRALRAAARMADFYETSDPALAKRLVGDADCLKEVLAQTLAKKHPDHVASVGRGEYEVVRAFLCNFKRFYTLNYDLLLYWALMQEFEPTVDHDDGFRADPEDPDAAWVAWNDYHQYGQNVYFIHGGLHLYADGATLKKLTFKRTGVALVEQIRSQLNEGAFPLIVTEGTAEEKHATILHHAYLAKCLRSLTSCEGSLFVLGHSLAENDRHVIRAIVEGKVKRCVGICAASFRRFLKKRKRNLENVGVVLVFFTERDKASDEPWLRAKAFVDGVARQALVLQPLHSHLGEGRYMAESPRFDGESPDGLPVVGPGLHLVGLKTGLFDCVAPPRPVAAEPISLTNPRSLLKPLPPECSAAVLLGQAANLGNDALFLDHRSAMLVELSSSPPTPHH